MKVNIAKLQAGGYIAYQPTPMVPQPQAQDPNQGGPPPGPGQQGSQEDEGYLDKNVMEKMLGKGITTDVMQYSQQLQSAYQQYQYMTDFQRNSYKGRQIRMMLKGDLGQLNALMRSKDDFDNSVQNAKSNNALDELAVTSNGLVVRDNESGKVTQVGFGDYAKNKGKYTALTNAQLAEQREYNKDLIGNSAVFSVLNFGKGMDKVQDEVYKIVSSIGKNSSTTANGAFDTNQSDNVKDLVSAARAGAFKIKNGESNETNVPQIQAAKQALWYNLSANSKAVLRARAATMTDDPNNVDKLAQSLMGSLLDPHTSTSHSVTYDESMTKGGKNAAGVNEKTEKHGQYGMAFDMAANTIPISQIGHYGVKIDGFASAIPTEAYTSKDGTRLPLTNANKLNNISYLSKAFTVNGDKVDLNLTSITGDAYITELPYTEDENGNYKIDEEGSKNMAQYQQEKKQLGNITPQADAELRDKYGVNRFKTKKFIVAEAASYDGKSFFSDRDKNYYNEITGADKEALRKIVDPNNDVTQHFHWGHNDAHKHLIFIPAKGETTWNSMDGNDALIPKDLYEIQRGYGRGNDGTGQGTPYVPQSPQQLGLTADQSFK